MRKNYQNDSRGTIYIAIAGKIYARAVEGIIRTISELPNETRTIYLLLNTAGGAVCHGFAIYNFLRALPYKIITHNIGNVDSIGNIIFLAGEERYATEHSLFLYHGVKVDPKLNLIDRSIAQEKFDGIEKDEYRIGQVYKAHTKMTDRDLKNFFEVGEFKTAETALKQGIIHDIRDLPELRRVVVVDIGE